MCLITMITGGPMDLVISLTGHPMVTSLAVSGIPSVLEPMEELTR